MGQTETKKTAKLQLKPTLNQPEPTRTSPNLSRLHLETCDARHGCSSRRAQPWASERPSLFLRSSPGEEPDEKGAAWSTAAACQVLNSRTANGWSFAFVEQTLCNQSGHAHRCTHADTNANRSTQVGARREQAQTLTRADTQTHRHTDEETHRHTDTRTRARTQTDTHTHKHRNTQAHRHTDAHLARTRTHRCTHERAGLAVCRLFVNLPATMHRLGPARTWTAWL